MRIFENFPQNGHVRKTGAVLAIEVAKKLRNASCPSGLMRRTAAAAGVTVKVLVKKGNLAEMRAAPVGVASEDMRARFGPCVAHLFVLSVTIQSIGRVQMTARHGPQAEEKNHHPLRLRHGGKKKRRLTTEVTEDAAKRRNIYITRIRLRGYPQTDSRNLTSASSVNSVINLFSAPPCLERSGW